MKSDVDHIRESRLFSGLFSGDLQSVISLMYAGVAKSKKIIYQPGDQSDTLYLIKSGRVRIFRLTEDGREIIIGMYQSGDIFGEMSFVEDTKREYFAEAIEEVQYLAIKRHNLFALAKKKPGIIYRLAKIIGQRRREAEATMEALLYKGVRERLAQQLLKLARDYGVDDERGKLLRIKITHKDLASLIGSSRETVSLTLGDLRKNGLIDINTDRKIIIRDEAQLAEMS